MGSLPGLQVGHFGGDVGTACWFLAVVWHSGAAPRLTLSSAWGGMCGKPPLGV